MYDYLLGGMNQSTNQDVMFQPRVLCVAIAQQTYILQVTLESIERCTEPGMMYFPTK